MPVSISQLKKINQNIKKFEAVRFMAVTKNRGLIEIEELIANGVSLFGENRVQEAQKKFQNLDRKCFELHLIGPLQTNKVKIALQIFNTIQTLDREKLVLEVKKYLQDQKSITSSFYIQVNIGDESQKSGISSKNLKDFYNFCINNDLSIKGLMCIPPNDKNAEIFFKRMLLLKESINADLNLSMGMSKDYEIALKNGSNLVRIGSLLFD